MMWPFRKCSPMWSQQTVVGRGSLNLDMKAHTGFYVVVTEPGPTTINLTGAHTAGKTSEIIVSYDQGAGSCDITMVGISLVGENGGVFPFTIRAALIQNFWRFQVYDTGAVWIIGAPKNYF